MVVSMTWSSYCEFRLIYDIILGIGYMTSQCCGYKPALTGIINGYDCVMIPGRYWIQRFIFLYGKPLLFLWNYDQQILYDDMKGASKHTNKAHLANGAGYGFCGGQLNSATGTARSTICCKFYSSLTLKYLPQIFHFTANWYYNNLQKSCFCSNANAVFNQIYIWPLRAWRRRFKPSTSWLSIDLRYINLLS